MTHYLFTAETAEKVRALITPELIEAFKAKQDQFLFLEDRLAAADLPCSYNAVCAFEQMLLEVDPTAF